MCSFAISEPVKTDKTTYVSCQSKPPKTHRYFLWKILAQWFFGFAHRKTTDTIWSKIWDAFFPWNFPDGRYAISSAAKIFFYFNVMLR